MVLEQQMAVQRGGMVSRYDTGLDREAIIGCLCDRAVEAAAGVGAGLIPAAVLVALIEREQGFNVLLTRRTEHLRDHAGQISFPGGRIEPHDPSPAAAALREAEEEVGLAAARVELIGRLPSYERRTGYLVHPVVGLVRPPVRLSPDPYEVAEIFEVPLAFFLDPGNHRWHYVEYEGRRHRLCAMPYKDYFIWGATAAILRELYRTLSGGD